MQDWISNNKILTLAIVLAAIATIGYFFFGWFKTKPANTSTATSTPTSTSSNTSTHTSLDNPNAFPGGFKRDATDGKCYGYDSKGNRAWVGDVECTSRGIN